MYYCRNRDCGVKLVVGQNFRESQRKIKDFRCKKCVSEYTEKYYKNVAKRKALERERLLMKKVDNRLINLLRKLFTHKYKSMTTKEKRWVSIHVFRRCQECSQRKPFEAFNWQKKEKTCFSCLIK